MSKRVLHQSIILSANLAKTLEQKEQNSQGSYKNQICEISPDFL